MLGISHPSLSCSSCLSSRCRSLFHTHGSSPPPLISSKCWHDAICVHSRFSTIGTPRFYNHWFHTNSVWSCVTPRVPLNSHWTNGPFPALLPNRSFSHPPLIFRVAAVRLAPHSGSSRQCRLLTSLEAFRSSIRSPFRSGNQQPSRCAVLLSSA